MTTIAEIRQQYPQYEDMSDEQLGRALHQKHYSDIPWEDFQKRTGLIQPRSVDDPPYLDTYIPEQPVQSPKDMSFGGRVRNDLNILKDAAIGGGRGVVQGATDIAGVVANPVGYAGNAAVPGAPFSTNVSADADKLMTDIGVPEVRTAGGRGMQDLSRTATGVFGGGAASNAITARMGVPPVTGAEPRGMAPARASQPGARTLEQAGVPLDRSQRTGGRFQQMLRSAVTNHPFTASRQQNFSQAQQRAFNRAVLRSIGSEADEATQSVMLAAKQKIGSVFDDVAKEGFAFDDVLQNQLGSVVDDALATVPQSELSPLLRNIDDLLSAVDDAGNVNGQAFIRLRSRLSALARRPNIGQPARQVEDAIVDALERSHPGDVARLRDAIDKWRSLRIIERTIDKGVSGDISPSRLANALATNQNRAMSVYGQGGDQQLVSLAQAGKSVLPQAIPDSGTIPRGLMQAPLRSIATAPLYRGAQNYLLRQPQSALQPGQGVLLPSAAAGMTQAERRRLELANQLAR